MADNEKKTEKRLEETYLGDEITQYRCQLSASEARFRELVETVNSIVLYVTPKGIVQYINEYGSSLLGYDKEELIGRPILDSIIPTSELSDRDLATFIEKLRQNPDLYTYNENGAIRRDGKRLWIAWSNKGVFDQQGQLTQILGIGQDITERRKAEQALRESEKKYRSILDGMEEGYFEVDLGGTITFCNESFAAAFGYSRQGITGLDYRDFVSEEIVGDVLETFSRVFTTGEPERNFVWTDGQHRWAETSISLLRDENGEICGFRALSKDITERKKAEDELVKHHEMLERLVEERTKELTKANLQLSEEIAERCWAEEALKESEKNIRLIIENAPDPMVVYDPTGKVEYLNSAFTRVFGWTLDELRDRKVDYVPPDEVEKTTRLFKKMFEGSGLNAEEVRRLTKDGSTLDISISAAVLYDEKGSVIGNVSTLQDITERKKAEEELKRAKKIAEEATQAKSEFLANMSHEIRTPMNAIIGLGQLAMRTDLDGRQRDYLEKINLSAQSLLGVINDILDFSKIEAGKMEIEQLAFDLDEVLDNLANLTALKAEEKGLEILFRIAPDVPRLLVGDPLRLGQVLINLVNNAVKFTSQGEIVVAVDRVREDEKKVELSFTVSDNGIGLLPEQMDRLFKSFSQADGSTTRQYGGTGLGLAICKSLVEMMNGAIQAESEYGHGTSMIFTAMFSLHEPQTGEWSNNVLDFSGMRGLVVDDNDMARKILCETLVSFGFQVTTATSGEEALEVLEAASDSIKYDIVLMDLDMPGANGLETAIRIKSDPRFTRLPHILMVSAYGRTDVVREAEEAGIEGLLAKPINRSGLLDAIANTLEMQITKKIAKVGGSHIDGEAMKRISGARVLLVEDNRINQQVAMELLQIVGVEVDVANNGREGLEAALSGDFDLVLMDIQMPEMDGLQATRAIRAQGGERLSALPIVAMTAHAMTGDRDKSLAAGMNDHITKPVSPAELHGALLRWIRTGTRRSVAQSSPKTVNGDVDLPYNSDLINIDAGLKRVAGNKKLYRSLLFDFMNDNGGTAEMIAHEVRVGDRSDARRRAHTLKGVAGAVGVDDVFFAAKRLENVLVDEKADARGAITELEKALAPVLSYLRQYFDLEQTDENACDRYTTPDGAETVRRNLGVLRLRLKELAELLELFDTEAEVVWAKIKKDVASLSPTGAVVLEERLNAFDFSGALEAFREIAATAGLLLDEGGDC